MSLNKTCNNCENISCEDRKHSFEWELIKEVTARNKWLTVGICVTLLLWFSTIIYFI